MTAPETARYEMLVRVRDFGASYGERFPRSTRGSDAFAAVNTAVTQLEQHGASQYSNRHAVRGIKATNTDAYRELLGTLDAIERTAQAVALEAPDARRQFVVPKKRGPAAVLNAARSIATDAEPLAKAFIAHGLPKDFIGQLEAKIAAFEEARKARVAAKEQHASARTAIEQAFESGMEGVQHLDAIVPNVIGDDGQAMAAWGVARHIEPRRARRRKKAAADNAVPPPAPAPAPAPAVPAATTATPASQPETVKAA
jgi:hypothetical protein